jgi:hypothetical protein
MERNEMNTKLLISVIAATLLPIAAYAHDCSGGTDGGMDATGNQCNGSTVVTSDRAASSTAGTKAEAKKTARNSTPTRNAAVRVRVKQS